MMKKKSNLINHQEGRLERIEQSLPPEASAPVIKQSENESERLNGILDMLTLAGRIISENGGEIFRVEETITRMGKGLKLHRVECFAVPSGFFISISGNNDDMKTTVLRVKNRGSNLDKVDRVNQISRDLEGEKITLQQAEAALKKLASQRDSLPYPLISLGVGVCSAGFALMFQGDLVDMLIAFAIGFLTWMLQKAFPKFGITGSASTLVMSFLLTMFVSIVTKITGIGNTEAIIPGVMMPLVPGLSMTSAIQDSVRGDALSGMTYGLNAVLTAILIAAGTMFGTILASATIK